MIELRDKTYLSILDILYDTTKKLIVVVNKVETNEDVIWNWMKTTTYIDVIMMWSCIKYKFTGWRSNTTYEHT
jgi:predicted GTPase